MHPTVTGVATKHSDGGIVNPKNKIKWETWLV
jgi:hypothetical protein